MSVRYEGGDGFPDLEVDDIVTNGTAPGHGRLSTLLRWNAEDPSSAFEMRRNDVIYVDFQHNRNLFIDHREPSRNPVSRKVTWTVLTSRQVPDLH